MAIPRSVGAAVVLLGIVGGIGTLAYSLSDEAAELIETLPDAARNFRQICTTRSASEMRWAGARGRW